MSLVTDHIKKRIRAKKRGWIFIPKDFLDLGPRTAVDQALSRLAKQGMIRRLDRGLYDYPRQHKILGLLSPDMDKLAQAITAKAGDKVFPSGAIAANLLGLSTQVPAKPLYMTNGPSRTKQIGGRSIVFKHARVPLLDRLSSKGNSILQALSYLGKSNIDDQVIHHCAKLLDNQDIKGLINSAPQLPGWLADTILRVQQHHHGSLLKQG